MAKGTKRDIENREDNNKYALKEERTAKKEEKKEKQTKNGTYGKMKRRRKEEIFPQGNFNFKCFLPEERYTKK